MKRSIGKSSSYPGGDLFTSDLRRNMESDSIYMIIEIVLNDEESFDPYMTYQEHVRPMAEKYGGRLVFRSYDNELLEGEGGLHFFAVMSWPNRESLQAWYESREYSEWKALRHRHTRTRLLLVKEAGPLTREDKRRFMVG